MKDRTIIFDNIVNARHLGSIETTDGYKVKENAIIRSGNLSKASKSDLQRLKDEYGLKKVYDFRSETERMFAPDMEVEGAENVWINILEKASADSEEPKDTRDISVIDEKLIRDTMPMVRNGSLNGKMKELYIKIVTSEASQMAYARLFDDIIMAGGGTVLWHCSQGKDRAGFASVLMLSALGVDRESILDDYELSNDGYREQLIFAKSICDEEDFDEDKRGTVKAMIGVNRRYMEDMFDLIDEKYESMDRYLHNQINLNDEKIELLKQFYLE